MKSTNERLAKSYCRPQTEEEWELLSPYFKNEVTFYSNVDSWQKDFEECGHVYFFQHFNGMLSYSKHPIKERTEIPVSHFINLLHDRIAPWRLADDGFAYLTPMIEVATYPIGNVTVCFHEGKTSVILDPNDSPWRSHVCSGVKTYTDLITLIQLIG